VRLAALGLLLLAGLALAVGFYLERTDTPLDSSLAPAFQLLGTPVKAVDRLAGRVIPVDDLDERDLGLVLRARYESGVDPNDADFLYVNDLTDHLSQAAGKPFDYRAYVLESSAPNAMALPGGVVLVTRGVLTTLRSEAEVAAVISHEIGHIEQGHCFDAVKFRLLAGKVGQDTLGALADLATRLLVSHSFSKTQEDEADEYAWARLVGSRYDPAGAGDSFESMIAWIRGTASGGSRVGSRTKAHVLRDYFSSHPPLEIREAKFGKRAAAWWRSHADQQRYVGRKNLADRKSLHSGFIAPGEWTGSSSGSPAPKLLSVDS
jgi:Zn-dependent protease with chaperone function